MIRLNCDLGESFGPWKMGMDEAVMPHIDLANIACGFHASDPITMQRTVALAKTHNVTIGAHPGYPDLVGFGRRSMVCKPEEISAFVIYQIGALSAIAAAEGMRVSYVKPHGALYNDMMAHEYIFLAILKAISDYDNSLKLMILSSSKNERYTKLASDLGVELLYEVFADRAYTDDGFLVSRAKEGALIHSADIVKERIDLLHKEGALISENGKKIPLKADTLCVHGDNQKALDLVVALRGYLGQCKS